MSSVGFGSRALIFSCVLSMNYTTNEEAIWIVTNKRLPFSLLSKVFADVNNE